MIPILLLFCCSMMVTNCASKIPFTPQVVDKYQLSDENIQNLQFYLSDDLVLRKTSTESISKVTNQNELKHKQGRIIQDFVFMKGLHALWKLFPMIRFW